MSKRTTSSLPVVTQNPGEDTTLAMLAARGARVDRLPARFEGRYSPEPNTGCWLWVGASTTSGYGQIRLGGKTYLAHRISWLLAGRELRNGLHLLHSCGVPGGNLCVNPDHLRPGTQQNNNDDRRQVAGYPRDPGGRFALVRRTGSCVGGGE